jgi:hypothetical protein
MTFRQRDPSVRNFTAACMVLTLLTTPVLAADIQYQTELDPAAFDNSTVKNNVGIGNVTASLSGNNLTVTGNYSGLSSEATDAHVKMGLAAGVPGPVIGDLKISGGMTGQISGTFRLNSAQAASLKQGGLSIVVDSTKAPQGNLWGWLHLPEQNQ